LFLVGMDNPLNKLSIKSKIIKIRVWSEKVMAVLAKLF
jgi:hypothetical protein